ncbi:MAG: GAF domain-containing protein [Chloroflexota bacterium]
MALETHPLDDKGISGMQRSPSLRFRIILAISITSILAAIAIGSLTFFRSQLTETFLGDRLQSEVKEKAESQIQALVLQEAQSINLFFQDVNSSIISTTDFAQNLLNRNTTFENGSYWDAAQTLAQLPNGAWDNPNTDPAAVFAPRDYALTEAETQELNSVVYLDFIVPDMLQKNPNIVAMYFGSNSGATIYYPNIDLAAVVPPDFDITGRTWYVKAKSSLYKDTKAVWSEPYLDAALNGLVVTGSIPILDQEGRIHGVLGADIKIATIVDRVTGVQIGNSGFAFLIDSSGLILAMPESGYAKFGLKPEDARGNEDPYLNILQQVPKGLQPVFQGMIRGETGLTLLPIGGVPHYVAFAPIEAAGYRLGFIAPESEMAATYLEAQAAIARENQTTRDFSLALLVIVASAAILIGAMTGRLLTNPLNSLTQTVQKIIAGDLTAQAPETSSNEIGVLARAFNSMTVQLRETLETLEHRVSERTAELAEATGRIQRRAAQFEAVAQSARAISTTQDLETLLPNIASVISKYFGFYHVGIFLLDDEKSYAVLRASNSEGGKRMIGRGHRLKVGEVGIVGYVTSRGQPRIALDTGADTVHFKNPDLPATRSELALPLRIGDQIIGALDVQSTEPNAFSIEDVNVLTILTDQVSTAIQNARLYEQTRSALAESQNLYRKFIRSGWQQYTLAKRLSGIRHTHTGSELMEIPLRVAGARSDEFTTLPITIRGEKVGEIHMKAPENRKWGPDDLEIASALIERAAIAMENVRLLDEAQRRATREQAIGEISASISTTSDMASILRIAVEELGRTMGGAEVILELGTDENKGDA